MTKSLDTALGVALSAIMVSGCAGVPRATEGGKLLALWGQVSTKSYIRVRGIGATSPAASGLTARRGASRSAALVSARYQLLSVIKGVKLEGGVTVSQLMERDSLIREIANEVVSGGDEVKTEWTDDDGCVVTLELKRAKVERLINEKSKREIDMEERIRRSINEIERLNLAVYVASMSKSDRKDWAHVQELALKAKRMGDDIDRIDKMIDLDKKQNTNMYDRAILEQVIDTSSRLAEEEKANCWSPFSACYWGYGRWSGTR